MLDWFYDNQRLLKLQINGNIRNPLILNTCSLFHLFPVFRSRVIFCGFTQFIFYTTFNSTLLMKRMHVDVWCGCGCGRYRPRMGWEEWLQAWNEWIQTKDSKSRYMYSFLSTGWNVLLCFRCMMYVFRYPSPHLSEKARAFNFELDWLIFILYWFLESLPDHDAFAASVP